MVLLPNKFERKGFTLIELMIAISVVAVLSTIGLAIYSNGQKLARDSRRKADLRQIQNSLVIFYNDQKRFPQTPSNDTAVYSDSAAAIWLVETPAAGTAVAFNKDYIDLLPKDPINTTTYRYEYLAPNDGWGTCTAGSFFLLSAPLENTADPDRYGKAPVAICGNTAASLSRLNNTYVLFQSPK